MKKLCKKYGVVYPLTPNCNTALGLLKDGVNILQKMIYYFKSYD